MSELFPVVAGLLVGCLMALAAPRLRWRIGWVGAVVLGTLATIVSGEFRIGWEFLLVDIPLVAVSSAAGLLITRHSRRAVLGDHG